MGENSVSLIPEPKQRPLISAVTRMRAILRLVNNRVPSTFCIPRRLAPDRTDLALRFDRCTDGCQPKDIVQEAFVRFHREVAEGSSLVK